VCVCVITDCPAIDEHDSHNVGSDEGVNVAHDLVEVGHWANVVCDVVAAQQLCEHLRR
jgi:hypothetical protein